MNNNKKLKLKKKKENQEPVDTAKEKQIFDIVTRKTNQLPEAERNLLEHGSTYIGRNAALCGVIAVFFRASSM